MGRTYFMDDPFGQIWPLKLSIYCYKIKEHASEAYKLIESYKPTRFTILIYFRSLYNFQNFDQLCRENGQNAKFLNFNEIVSWVSVFAQIG